MKDIVIILILVFFSSQVFGQKKNEKVKESAVPITIQWVDKLDGDYSFTEKWSYPMWVCEGADGRAGCANGGFCPERCYGMMDSNYIVMKDSV